jgi:hypothetical protein
MVDGAASEIIETVTAWPGVEQARHRFGGIKFQLGKRELGHLHGDELADLPFTRKLRDELIATGRARPHHILPDTGWVSFPIDTRDDIQGAIALFRLSYDRALTARTRADPR